MLHEEIYQKEYSNKITLEKIHGELFITKCSNQEYDSKTFIVDSGAMYNMVTKEENMSTVQNAERLVTVGDSGIFIVTHVVIHMATSNIMDNSIT